MKNNSEKTNNSFAEDAQKASSAVLRKCCACGKISDRNEFIRILKDYKTSEVIINPNSNQFGRSLYLCKSMECIKLAQKKKKLKNLSDTQIEALTKLVITT